MPVLAEILDNAGYTTGAVIALGTLSERWGFDRGFDVFEDRLRNAWILSADRVLPHTLATLEGLEPPFFLWSHFADPHEPYRAHGTVEHDAEVTVGGRVIGRVSSSSSEVRLLDLELEPGPNEVVIRGQHPFLVRRLAVIKPPRGFSRPTRRRTDPAGLIDVMPTVLGFLGLEPQPLMRGRDLLEAGAERLDPILFMETHRPQARKTLFGRRGARHAVILDATEKSWELYDLLAEPVQHVNIFDPADPAHSRWADRLRDRLRREAKLLDGAPDGSETDEAAREMLRSLGLPVSARSTVVRARKLLPTAPDAVAT